MFEGFAEKQRTYFDVKEAAAGYINPNRAVDENADHRRMNDGVLHGQYTPKVYPFKDISGKGTSKDKENDVSMYGVEFVPKPMAIRKGRPTSINRRNNPQPNIAFHMKHIQNQGIPVVRTRMTLEDFQRKPIDSPYMSNSHRVYRKYQPSEIEKAKPFQQIARSASGIVPELNKPDADLRETRLFPVIPRNARLTADRAQALTNSVIKPRKNKYQPHLSGASSLTDETFPYLPIKDLNKPALKPVSGPNDCMEVASWDSAPLSTARTTSRVYGRKRADKTKFGSMAQAVVPELPPPTSKSLMFKEYAQYPKYAPQMLDDYYRGRVGKEIVRPFVY
ncbi:unnamed protein product [Clavelina lepadiformis]|uniref:Uncharacterized protein n=1 Tax=Clavelina lepadiformis TaxID=159417 RepID=A0ABP0GZL1_CLALP